MCDNSRRVLVIVLLGAMLMLSVAGAVFAGRIGTAWETGVVTKAPWIGPDNREYIEIEGNTYRFVSKEVRKERHISMTGGIQIQNISLTSIREGWTIKVLVAGMDIYQLVYEGK